MRRILLGAEAERIRIAHQFDPLLAVNSSIGDLLPHQVEAVYRYLLPLRQIRFLLADDIPTSDFTTKVHWSPSRCQEHGSSTQTPSLMRRRPPLA